MIRVSQGGGVPILFDIDYADKYILFIYLVILII